VNGSDGEIGSALRRHPIAMFRQGCVVLIRIVLAICIPWIIHGTTVPVNPWIIHGTFLAYTICHVISMVYLWNK